MFITFSGSLWSTNDPPIIQGPYTQVRTEPQYNAPAALIVKYKESQETVLTSQWEENPQYWWINETPYTQMSINLETVCVEPPSNKGRR